MKRTFSLCWESAVEWGKDWWFIFSLFTVPILGLLTSFVGFTIAHFENNYLIFGKINYAFLTNILTGHLFYYSMTQPNLKEPIVWFIEKIVFLFLAFALAYFFLAIIPNLKDKKTGKKLLFKTAVYFLIINIVIEIIGFIIFKLVGQPYLLSHINLFYIFETFLSNLFKPFTLSSFILIAIISIIMKESFNLNKALRIIAFFVILYVILATTLSILEINKSLNVLTVFLTSLFLYLFYYFLPFVSRGENAHSTLRNGINLIKTHPELILLFAIVSFAAISLTKTPVASAKIIQLYIALFSAINSFLGVMILSTIFKVAEPIMEV